MSFFFFYSAWKVLSVSSKKEAKKHWYRVAMGPCQSWETQPIVSHPVSTKLQSSALTVEGAKVLSAAWYPCPTLYVLPIGKYSYKALGCSVCSKGVNICADVKTIVSLHTCVIKLLFPQPLVQRMANLSFSFYETRCDRFGRGKDV